MNKRLFVLEDYKDAEIPDYEIELIHKIANRAYIKYNNIVFLDMVRDISICHIVCPLHLERLLHSKNLRFFFDINGIQKNINKQTKRLENSFFPSCAKYSNFKD